MLMESLATAKAAAIAMAFFTIFSWQCIGLMGAILEGGPLGRIRGG